MRMTRRYQRLAANERGAALTVVLVMIVVLTIIGIAMVDSALTEVTIAGNQRFGFAATHLAEAGVGEALDRILDDSTLGQTAACTLGTLTFPAGALESGIYEVCVQRRGTLRVITSTGRARSSGDPSDAAVKTVRRTVRVIPSNLASAIFSRRDVELFQLSAPTGDCGEFEVGNNGFCSPVVIQTVPPSRPIAVQGGPTPQDGSDHVFLRGAGTRITGGLSIGGGFRVEDGASNPCSNAGPTPFGPYSCDVNFSGPAFPTFNIRYSDPGTDATSFEGRARADTIGCGRAEGCYFSSESDFRNWVADCDTPQCQVTANGKVLGPGVFFINNKLVVDKALDLGEVIGTLVIGNSDLEVRAGFTASPCWDPTVPKSCSDPVIVVHSVLKLDKGDLNKQCRDVVFDGMTYIETKDFEAIFAPEPLADQGSCYPTTIKVRFAMIIAREIVRLHGAIRVAFDAARLDELPPGLLTSSTSAPAIIPLGWVSQ